MRNFIFPVSLILASWMSSCSISPEQKEENSLLSMLSQTENIKGNNDYIKSPFVTAGDRVYMVGHQDGSFPDLGWHVEGEMGGIWDHPIKLMDGFQVTLMVDEDTVCLDRANEFTNYPMANQHSYLVNEFEIERMQFVPDRKEGMIVEFAITNIGDDREIGFNFTGLVDLTPVWLAERKQMDDGRDEARYNQQNEAIIAKDKLNDWFVVFGSDRRPDYHGIGSNFCNRERKGKGVDGTLSYQFNLASGQKETLRFFIAGSYTSLDSTWNTFKELKSDPKGLLTEKIKRYDEIKNQSRLEIVDKGLEQAYRWVKYNTDWLIREVPEVGRGLSAGMPDYPWWFGADNAYSLQGLLATGKHEDALSTIDLVMKLSREANDGNGRIMHEASTNGVIFNPGNLNETPHFIYTLWKAYEWTGDQSIIDNYYEDVKKGIRWIESQDKDGNGYPDGPGMMEIHGLHSEMIDVAVYQQKAYEAGANFASIKTETELVDEYQSKAKALASKINNEWWVEDFNSFADFRSNKSQAIELIEAAIVRADTIDKPWSKEELQKTLEQTRNKSREQNELSGYVAHHNWVVNTPMEMGIADPEKASKALATARNYQNRFGMYVTGMDRDESQEKAEKWISFSYVGAVMTLPTGVQAIAEANYGNPDGALAYLKMLENSFSYALPGSMYEVSPDYGMIAQAWNIYAMATPVVEHFFGIKPRAYKKEITIKPLMPSDWENVKLSNVRVGENEISIEKSTDGDLETFKITQTQPDWKIDFVIEKGLKVKLNGEVVQSSDSSDDQIISFSGSENQIEIER